MSMLGWSASLPISTGLKPGAQIKRFNLAQPRQVFAQNGAGASPVVMLGGQVVLAGSHPCRQALILWAGVAPVTNCRSSSCCEQG